MSASIRFRAAAALGLALLVHLTLMSELRLVGVRADVLLLVAVAAGLVGGPERGAILGFASGVAADLFLEAPFGLSALCYCLVGFAVGSLQTGILRSAWWIPMLTAFVASVAGIVLYALLGATVGQTEMVSPRLPLVAAVVGVMNGFLAPGSVRLIGWALNAKSSHTYPA